MVVREIDQQDISLIAALEREIFPDPWSEQAIRESFHHSQTVMLGAYKAGILLGYIILYFVLDEGEIARIAVKAQQRRNGIAGHLFLALSDWCKKHTIEQIFLDVREHNEPAIAFYQKQGFRENGIRKNFYTNPNEDGILMNRAFDK